MKTVGIFEAKTKFTALCSEVAAGGAGGESVLVQRRGKPLVMISPVPAEVTQTRADIYSAWKEWAEGESDEDLAGGEDFPEVWLRRVDRVRNPLDESA